MNILPALLLFAFALLPCSAQDLIEAEPVEQIEPKPPGFPFDWNPNKKWADEIAQLTAEVPNPPERPVLFAGSSSFRRWDLAASFPDLPICNHGFGGSTFPDLLHFADELIFSQNPGTLVIYEGDNDLFKGRTPNEVLKDWKTLVALVSEHLPNTPVVFVSIKPSVQRWQLRKKIRAANKLICAHCEGHPHLHFADISTPMLEFNGIPKAHLFDPDALHVNEAGYQLWAEVLNPLIAQIHPTAPPAEAIESNP